MNGVDISAVEVPRSMSLMIPDILLNLVPRNSVTSNVIGASVFVPENKILMENAKKFGLVEVEDTSDDAEDDDGFAMSAPFTRLADD